MQTGDYFDFTEIKLLVADTEPAALALAEEMVKDWHKSHWTDCGWAVDKIKRVQKLEDLFDFIPPFSGA